jgi:hypothetical protein
VAAVSAKALDTVIWVVSITIVFAVVVAVINFY